MAGLVAFMTRELFRQLSREGAIRRYLVSADGSGLREKIPGSIAFCGLAAAVLREEGFPGGVKAEELIVSAAARAFFLDPGIRTELEIGAREALTLAGSINEDLLAESLGARAGANASIVASALDALATGAALQSALAGASTAGRRSASMRLRIRGCLGLGSEEGSAHDPGGEGGQPSAPSDVEPYLLLGVRPGAPLEEIKNAFRQLAVSFHPDSLTALDDARAKSAEVAFIRIEAAYREVLRREGHRRA